MNLFFEFDKAGAEWIVVAYLSGDENMLRVVREKKSPHVVTGSLITGIPEDIVIKENNIVGHNTDPGIIEDLREQIPELQGHTGYLPRTMSIRQMGKKDNHGLNYDIRYRRFALENEITEVEAKLQVSAYRERAYPGVPRWHKQVENKLRKDRTLTNCFGRKRVFKDAWGPDLLAAAYAQVPQSTVFDITREAMVKAFRDESRDFAPMEQLAQVHDSVLCQFPITDIPRAARFCQIMALDYMNPTLEYSATEFNLDTTVTMGLNWGEGNMHPVSVTEDIDKTIESLTAVREEILRVGQKVG